MLPYFFLVDMVVMVIDMICQPSGLALGEKIQKQQQQQSKQPPFTGCKNARTSPRIKNLVQWHSNLLFKFRLTYFKQNHNQKASATNQLGLLSVIKPWCIISYHYMFLVSPGCFMMSLLLVPKPQKNYWNSWSIPLKPKKYLFWSTSIVSLNLRVHGLEITWKLAFPWNVSAISQCTTFLRGNVPSLVASLVHLNHLKPTSCTSLPLQPKDRVATVHHLFCYHAFLHLWRCCPRKQKKSERPATSSKLTGTKLQETRKVDGTVPIYWFIRTLFKPTFWLLCQLFWP